MLAENKKLKIAIIGFGRFGKLLRDILSPYGNIFVLSRKKVNAAFNPIKYQDLQSMDWVILAVPINALEKVLKKISPFLSPQTLVMDVASVKVYPCRWMKEILPADVDILGTHPMFGPDSIVEGLENLQMVFCPVRISDKNLFQVKKIFQKIGLKVIETTPQNHDRQSAISLALVHFIGRGLEKIGIQNQEISTLGFKRLLQLKSNVVSDTQELFFDMHNFNPYAAKTRQDFLNALQKINLMLKLKIKK